MPSPLHDRLVTLGARWLRRQGFGAVVTELASYATREQPDVLGFRSTCSAIIEVKVSRSDFLRDRKKPHRATGGIGNYRFYLCPADVVSVEDLPEKWGLLHYAAGKIVEIVRPHGNVWPPAPHPDFPPSLTHWAAFYHASDPQMERDALYSIARRSHVSHTRTPAIRAAQ